ncbi:putative helix-turn-helix domain-containing protein [Clostridioides difficile DA00130]|uniref:transcriptional regulator n=1 Tax=Clostridioides difficile TaxID=1496 RepID=UPI00038D85A0|nr:putative helix-turn-helix domain-containing protein [Clostridioides difficile CD39]EQF91835.1 putative helix-turn-helix domain-containing protein [Clostridioides difficile 840]EQG53363.1 putative helix-turn-helix domain-containing protein [Clostridioides difficile DA00131]EQK83329.1 putative helix-turn-helix domain-containing protein [Clostridioides difficile CD111]ERM45317.1 putative helix-turn-helix domain-containing protein [Clostridioides difficile DA00130]
MRKTKETHTFDFRPLGLAIREAREKAGLSRNDLGDKVFYGEAISQILKISVHTQVFNYSMI